MNKQIPYIPKQTIDFRPMQYLYCESEPNSKLVTRATFLRLLEQQPCPMAQVNIDLEGGYAYLFPYCPERAKVFIQLNREMAAAYKRHYRSWQTIKEGKRKPELSLDMGITESGTALSDRLSTEETPESVFLLKERFAGYRASFDALAEADRELLIAYFSVDRNARELARRLGKDPSGVAKRVKRAMKRLQENIKKYT